MKLKMMSRQVQVATVASLFLVVAVAGICVYLSTRHDLVNISIQQRIELTNTENNVENILQKILEEIRMSIDKDENSRIAEAVIELTKNTKNKMETIDEEIEEEGTAADNTDVLKLNNTLPVGHGEIKLNNTLPVGHAEIKLNNTLPGTKSTENSTSVSQRECGKNN